MDVVQVAVETVTKAVDVMSRKMSALIKAKMDEKADISEVPVKVSDLTNDSNFQNAQQVEDKIDAKISSAYKVGGSATMATLPALTAAKLGVVVNMSEGFTTTADFLEGAGKTYPAGTNIVVASAGENAYKYDVLSGFVDLSGYVEDTRKVGGVLLSADIPVTLTGDTAITVTNTGTASAIGYSVVHKGSGVTAGSKGDTTNQTPAFGGTFKVLSATVDAKGHVTALGDHTVKVPNATATSQADGLMSKGDKAKLDAIGVTASAPLEVTKTGETYNVTLKDSGVTAGSKGDTTNQTPAFGGTFKVLSATVDAKGHVTNLAEHTTRIPDTVATTSAAGLMSAADKAKLDNIIDATLSHTGQAADAKTTGDNFSALQSLIRRMEIHCTASGNPATFADADAADIKDLRVTITPAQSGSGDPSPTNIRPISGVSSVSVTRTGENGTNPQTVTMQLTDGSDPLTVYGGTLDVTTGKLTVTHKGTDMGGLNFNYNSSNDVFAANINDCKSSIRFGYEDGLCSMFTVFRGEFSQFLTNSFAVIIAPAAWSSNSPYLVVSYKGITDSNAFRTAVSGQTIVYPLAAPLTYQLTPQQLATLRGYNAVSADAGSVDVTYKADNALIPLGGNA